MMNSMEGVEDDALLQMAGESDGAGQMAVVESSRRLRKAILEAKASIDRLTRRLILLTWGLLALTGILALLAVPPAVETVEHLGWFGLGARK